MKTCPSCGRQNADDTDFCECGEYLRWDPTAYRPAVRRTPTPGTEPERDPTPPHPRPARPPDPVPVARQPPVLATLVLRMPDGDVAGPDGLTVTAEAGGRTTVLGLLRNESTIVDNYDLSIRGLPDGWWSVTPRVAYLVPYGTSGAYEQEFEAEVHPPRTPEAFARPWPFEVIATSRAHTTTAASAQATLIVTPYIDVSSEVRPERATGRWRVRYVLSVRNTSNALAEVDVRGEDTDGSCWFRFPQQSLTVRPGEHASMEFIVRPPRQIWVGQPIERQLSVFATPTGVDKQQAPSRAVFRQRSWLPKWVLTLLVVVLLLAAGGGAAAVLSSKSKKAAPCVQTGTVTCPASK